MSEFRGVTPPNSVEAEQSVLGAMMQDENAVLQAAEALSTDDFYQPAHREIFEAMVALHHQQRPIDLVTVDAELTRRGTLEGIGGTEYLMRLMSFVPTTANVKAYITLVAEKSTLRKLIKASQEISQECYSQQNPLQETLGHAEKAIFDIVMNRASGESLVHVRDVLYNTYANIEELAKLQSEVAAKLEKTDYKSYAKELVEIVKSKDMEGLADHIDFPAFISCVKTNGGMVDTKEDFMKLDPVEIFSDEMEAAIGKVDVDTLEPVMAGIVLGDGVPNIILGITVDGELAITGMNY